MSFSIRQLKYFVVTAELGQISQAAKELCISQSAITTAIKEVEHYLRQDLFIRSSKGVSLTEAGQLFLPKARQILVMIDETTRLPLSAAAVEGVLRVGVTYTVIGYFLPHHIQRLTQLHPNLKIEVYELDRKSIETKLLNDKLDFGVLLTSNLSNETLRYETFINSTRRLWVSSHHELLSAAKVSLKDLQKYPYIMLTVDEAEQTVLKYWGEEQPNVQYRTSSIEAIRSMVANDNGIAILSDMVYRPWSLEGKRIETITLQEKVPPMEVGLVWKGDVKKTVQMEAFYDYFHSIFCTPLFTKTS
ncbi:LysR family transcriptional regulator [Hydromonas duriensis]|uniref:LysR family transcriptional regulator n=1 Tax=Hydromonas duriensis TaxID=1527608 RepID=A0A4R6Y8V3_9BURK|nr:LysR family transcriptional regulator [Hydromonas duriensis]TDR31847.1 LysR family transcriptional regulator [Hydromonas duriensis]